MKNLGDFPVEILLSIANNISINDLYTCTLISKKLYAATNPLLWREPNVRNSTSLFKVTTGIFLAQHPVNQHIRKLDLGMGIDNTTLLLLLKHANCLEELKVHHGELITDESFQHIPQHCPLLNSLYLNDVSITDHSMIALGKHCHQLRELTLSNCFNISPISFVALAHCPLTTLSLISPSSSQDLWMAREMVESLALLELLTALSISFGSTHFIQNLLMMNNTTTTTELPTPWPHLSHLHLKKCGSFDDQHMMSFIKLHPRLHRLYFCENSITDDTLTTISSSSTHIIEIGIDSNPQITTGAIRQLIWDQPLLSYISCNRCVKSLADFPEAGDDECDGEDVVLLGKHTINKIRLGTFPSGRGDNGGFGI